MRHLILVILVSFTAHVYAADLPISNAGFAPSNIWYSKDPFYAGESVRIYTVIFNGSAYDLTGAVEFLDNGVSLGKAKFSISHGGRAQDLWVDWKAEEGRHAITARLAGVVADGPNGKQSVVLPNAETGKNERVIEVDPIIKEAQAKADAQKIAEVRAQTVGKIEGFSQNVVTLIPEPIKDGVSLSVGAVERFRTSEANQLGIIKKQKIKELDAIVATSRPKPVGTQKVTTKNTTTNEGGSASIAEKPFAYAMVAAVGAAQFVFGYKILFYGIILYTVYRLVKWSVCRIRNRPQA